MMELAKGWRMRQCRKEIKKEAWGNFLPFRDSLLSFEPGSSLPMQMSVPGFQAAPLSLIQ